MIAFVDARYLVGSAHTTACHRVVQKNGALRGYGVGLWRKRFLLALETKK